MKIKINFDTYTKMFLYAKAAEKHFGSEIAGWGHYSPSKGIYKLSPLPEQEVNGAEVTSFPNINSFFNSDYDVRDLNVQWHSHVNMGVFFSNVDVDNIKETLRIMPFLVSIVVNVKGEYKARFDMKINKRGFNFIHTEDVELDVIYPSMMEIENEVKKKCKKPEIKVYSPAHYVGNYRQIFTGEKNVKKDGKKNGKKKSEDLEKFMEDLAVLHIPYKRYGDIVAVKSDKGEEILVCNMNNQASITYKGIEYIRGWQDAADFVILLTDDKDDFSFWE